MASPHVLEPSLKVDTLPLNRSFRRLSAVAAFAVCLVLAACAASPAVPEPALDGGQLPAVAAQYRTRVIDPGRPDGRSGTHAGASVTEWRLWRRQDSVISENLDSHTSEVWQQDGRSVFHKKLWHEERRGIEFQMEDLRLVGALPPWSQTAMLVNPALLPALKLEKSGWRDGYPYRRYIGEVDGVRWDISFRTDLMLPTAVERRQGKRSEHIELIASYPIDRAPWQPTPGDDYELIDFADLGDREDDPFVLRVQSQLDIGHAH